MVTDLERLALEQRVGRLVRDDRDEQSSTSIDETKREASERMREAGGEGQAPVVVTQPAEPGDGTDPRSREGGDVQSVTCVVLKIAEVDQCRLRQVVIGQLQIADLSRHDGLGARR